MTIIIAHMVPPETPATNQHPNAVRYGPYTIGGVEWWVDATGGQPSQGDVEALLGTPTTKLKDYAAEKRRAVRNGGCVVTVNGSPLPTWADPDSCGAITSMMVALTVNPAFTTGWKGRDGAFHAVDGAGIQQLALGMLAFVDACFVAEAAVLADIEAEVITTKAAVDAAAWPSNS
jgi:hypothetical protein